jgi:hypothetical protein
MQYHSSRTGIRRIRRWITLIAGLLFVLYFRYGIDSQRENPRTNGATAQVESDLGGGQPAVLPEDDQPGRGKLVPPADSRDGHAAVAADEDSSRSRTEILRLVGDDIWESTAGLRYIPGSREGHRLQHVLLHTKDQPNRPGSHGVFLGGRDGSLQVIDEAYTIALQRDGRTRERQEGRRTVYTVDLEREIGFVGGQTGQAQGHPKTHHVRLVLEGVNVITAFPLIPTARQ